MAQNDQNAGQIALEELDAAGRNRADSAPAQPNARDVRQPNNGPATWSSRPTPRSLGWLSDHLAPVLSNLAPDAAHAPQERQNDANANIANYPRPPDSVLVIPPQEPAAPAETVPNKPLIWSSFITWLKKDVVRAWITIAITFLGIIVTIVVGIAFGVPSWRGYWLAKWTAQKAYRDGCLNDRSNGLYSADCNKTLSQSIQRPPYTKRRPILGGDELSFADACKNDRTDTVIIIAVIVLVASHLLRTFILRYIVRVTSALVPGIVRIKLALVPDIVHFTLFLVDYFSLLVSLIIFSPTMPARGRGWRGQLTTWFMRLTPYLALLIMFLTGTRWDEYGRMSEDGEPVFYAGTSLMFIAHIALFIFMIWCNLALYLA